MSYVIVSEKYSLKPLRALLLIAASAGDIAAVFLFFAAFAEHLLFAAAAGVLLFDYLLRRISLETVFSYRYELREGELAVFKVKTGKSKRIAVFKAGEKLVPCDGSEEGKRLYGDSYFDLYAIKDRGKTYILSLDEYMYSLFTRREDDIS